MSEDDYDTPPPPKIKEYPKGWVLKFDDNGSGGYFYYNRKLKVSSKRTPINAEEFGVCKIRINKYCFMKIDNEGDPYYICKTKEKEKISSRKPPVNMYELFPYGIELTLTHPFFKKLDEKKMVTIEKPEEKVKTELDAYLQALSKGIHCDENTPCDEGYECDLENEKCVPKTDKIYYDDLKRHEEDGASFVGKSATIQNLIDSITAKKNKEKKKLEKARKKQEAADRQREEEEAARQREEEEARQREEEEEAARQKKKDEKAAKKKKKEEEAARQREEAAARQREEEAARQKKKDVPEEDVEELNVDDVLDPDYENLSALQKALMDCLVPK